MEVDDKMKTKTTSPGQVWTLLGELMEKSVMSVPPSVSVEEAMKEIESKLKGDQITASELVDALWFANTMTPYSKEPKTSFSCLSSMVKMINERKLVDEWLLRERLEPEILEVSGLVRTAQWWSKKVVITNTRIFYTQRKFNLLREESEGFSKLLVELVDLAVEPDLTDEDACSRRVQTVQSLIGFFDLDPTRVIDIALTALEIRDQRLPIDSPASFKLPLFFNKLLRQYRIEYITQLIGFKLQRYHEAKDGAKQDNVEKEGSRSDDRTLMPVLNVSALLVREGLVELDNLWPHLSPQDPASGEEDPLCLLETTFREKCKALAKKVQIVSLAKDEIEKELTNEEELELLQRGPYEGSNCQKIGLLAASLRLGDWSTAEVVITRLGTETTSLDVALHGSVAQALTSLADSILAQAGNYAGSASHGSRKRGHLPLGSMEQGIVPPLSDVEGWVKDPSSHPLYDMLKVLRSNCYRDTRFLFRLTRFFASIEKKESIHPDLFDLIVRDMLLPGVSLTRCNAPLSVEFWEAIQSVPLDKRFEYYHWLRREAVAQNPILLVVNAMTAKETRGVLRRLTKDNEKHTGRSLAKIAHGNCMPVFDAMLEQVKSYENIIPPLVESLRYVTNLAFDTLLYSCVQQLSNRDRDRLKQDGTNIAQWFANLCAFSGLVLRRYPASLEMKAFLGFAFNSMQEGDPLVIFLLSEVVSSMTGISIIEELSLSQIESLNAGPILKDIVITNVLSAGGTTISAKKSETKLRDELFASGLTSHLPIAVEQQRQDIIFSADFRSRPLKIIGNVYDRCQDFLTLYSEFLQHQNATKGTKSKRLSVLGVGDLVAYNVEPDIAFQLNRYQMDYLELELDGGEKLAENEADEVKDGKAENAMDESEDKTEATEKPTENGTEKDQQQSFSLDFPLPEHIIKNLSPEFYTTFWCLSLYDIYFSKTAYETEINKRNNVLRESPPSEVGTEQTERNKTMKTELSQLEKESKDHEAHTKAIFKRLRARKSKFFPGGGNKLELVNVFLERCVVPRCIASQSDSVYTARFVIDVMVELDVEEFNIVAYISTLCRSVGQLVFACTEAEASRFGRFLCETLTVTEKWRTNKKLFESECLPKACFDFQSKDGHAGFVLIMNRMNQHLAKAFHVALESTEYMQVRNALVVLIAIQSVFPKTEDVRSIIVDRVDKLRNGDREDIRLMSTSYFAMLEAGKRQGKSEGVKSSSTKSKKKPVESTKTAPPTKSNAKVAEKGSSGKPKSTADDVEKDGPKTNDRENRSTNDSNRDNKREAKKDDDKRGGEEPRPDQKRRDEKPNFNNEPAMSPRSMYSETIRGRTGGRTWELKPKGSGDAPRMISKALPQLETSSGGYRDDRRSPVSRRNDMKDGRDGDHLDRPGNAPERQKRHRGRDSDGEIGEDDQMKRRRAESLSPNRFDQKRSRGPPNRDDNRRMEYGPSRPVSPRGQLHRSDSGQNFGMRGSDREPRMYPPGSQRGPLPGNRAPVQARLRRPGGRDDRR
ncbi:hypothetical protein NDN08_008058 [Rhodosorus marinus]|uniref:THO complex subunit 2 n=1 Tax=Rhodosorus marinus TaxID=101924 RepID=A0AAV8UZB8_9RHOD|nr:hypothetical protein NDN08_008058 [Rhodosorus marinus]